MFNKPTTYDHFLLIERNILSCKNEEHLERCRTMIVERISPKDKCLASVLFIKAEKKEKDIVVDGIINHALLMA